MKNNSTYSNPLAAVPTIELMKLWGELVEAYHGVNGFGGHTAEIYSYRLQRYDPSVHRRIDRDGAYNDKSKTHYTCAAHALCALLYEFCSAYNCDAEIEGLKVDDWCKLTVQGDIVFDHRAHVRIKRD